MPSLTAAQSCGRDKCTILGSKLVDNYIKVLPGFFAKHTTTSVGHEHEFILADMKARWNFAQYSNKLQYFYSINFSASFFKLMERLIAAFALWAHFATFFDTKKEQTLYTLVKFITRVIDTIQRSITTLQSFSFEWKALLPRRRRGWCTRTISVINRPTILIKFKKLDLYKTQVPLPTTLLRVFDTSNSERRSSPTWQSRYWI